MILDNSQNQGSYEVSKTHQLSTWGPRFAKDQTLWVVTEICKSALWPKTAEDVTLSLEWLIFLYPLSFFSPTKCVCSAFGL